MPSFVEKLHLVVEIYHFKVLKVQNFWNPIEILKEFRLNSLKTQRPRQTGFLRKLTVLNPNFKTRGHSRLKFGREWWNRKLKSCFQKFSSLSNFWGSHGHFGSEIWFSAKSTFLIPKTSWKWKFLFGNYRKWLYSMLRIISDSLAGHFYRLQTNQYFRSVCGQFLIPIWNIGNLYGALTQRSDGVW